MSNNRDTAYSLRGLQPAMKDGYESTKRSIQQTSLSKDTTTENMKPANVYELEKSHLCLSQTPT